MMFRPTELHAFLSTHQKKPNKTLSQNFLIDGNILRKMIACSGVKKEDLVVEIGSGPGALTQILLELGVQLIAIEKDPLFARELLRLQTEDHRLEVIAKDVLDIPFEEFNRKPIKIIANLPYQITTPVLGRLLNLYGCVESLTIMVQKEVALRLTAKKGTEHYSPLTLFCEYHAETSYCFTVAPSCFYPVPKVHSAVVHLQLKAPYKSAFPEQLIRTVFQKRRKMVRTSLKDHYPLEKIETAFDALQLSSELRPENLSLDNFIELQALLSEEKTNRE
jgi:16S rRNA (adenine1518-N6/adenine1519-N6)-dimethyltransferase